MPEKIKVIKVEFLWSESGVFQRNYPHGCQAFPSFPTLEDARCYLIKMSHEAPAGGGYHKTKFKVTWADGEAYEGRYDLKRLGEQQDNPNHYVDLADHVRGRLTVYAGRVPWFMSKEKHAELLRLEGYTPEKQARLQEFIDTHEM